MPEIEFGSLLMAIQPPLSWWGLCLAVLLIIIRTDVVSSLMEGRVFGIARLAIQVSAVLVLAGALGPVWWHFWMYHGWAGPPSFITSILAAADQSADWTTHKEMVVTLCMMLTMVVISLNVAAARQVRSSRGRR